jgi:hypothetical protein
MALLFPTTGLTANVTTYSYSGNSWLWDGNEWNIQSNANPVFSSPTVNGTLTVNNLTVTGSTTGVGSVYTLPIAGTSSGTLGGVKVDGTSITINPSTGVISGSNQFTLPVAKAQNGANILGGVIPDGVTILVDANGVISGASTFTLVPATTTVLGGVKIPVVATSGITNTSGVIGLTTASNTQLGGVKVDGTSITINNGVISGYAGYTLTAATTTVLGGVTVPATANSGLTNTSGAIRLATATTSQLGGVKVDGSTILINGSGVISAQITGAIVFQGGWDATANSPVLSNSSSAYNTNGFEFVVIKAGTVNFGAGNVSFGVGDNVIFNGTSWIRVPIGSASGTTNNLLSFDATGTGAVAGSSFNGSATVTVSYNSIGASPTAGNASLVTVGTIATGTWNADVISPTYGGTGINNSTRTLTITGGSRTLDQDVSSGASPSFSGTNITGTASGLTAGIATTATTATTATNIASGALNQLPIQTAGGTTGFVSAPSGATVTYLRWSGSTISWAAITSVANATTAGTTTNVAGGALNRIVYNTAADTTAFVTAPTVNATYLQYTTAGGFVWSAVSGATGGTVTSVSGTGTVNGLTLTGTITTSGSLTLGGTLSLTTAPAIGSVSASTGAFTTLSASSTVSGTGFSNYLASPPAIGSTAAAAVSTTQLNYSGAGTGGTVTQLISRSQGVSLNTITGTITLFAATLAAGNVNSFTLTNSKIAATDHVIITHSSGGTGGVYSCTAFPSAGTAVIYVTNISTSTTSSEAPVFKFTVIKSVNA